MLKKRLKLWVKKAIIKRKEQESYRCNEERIR